MGDGAMRALASLLRLLAFKAGIVSSARFAGWTYWRV